MSCDRVAAMRLVLLMAAAVCCPSLSPAEQADETSPDLSAANAFDRQIAPARHERSQPSAADEARRSAFEAGIEEVRRSGILQQALRVGDRAVEFELADGSGSQLRINELWAVGPVVLVFYRGGWCPFCERHLHELQESLLAIHNAGGQLVAVSPELPAKGLQTQVNNKLTFPVLSDEGNAVARQYGIVYRISDKVIPFYDQFFNIEAYNGDRSYELPLAATYVIDRGGVIRYAFLEADYKLRADTKEILAVLRRLGGSTPPAE